MQIENLFSIVENRYNHKAMMGRVQIENSAVSFIFNDELNEIKCDSFTRETLVEHL
jgi:hypothetical protein